MRRGRAPRPDRQLGVDLDAQRLEGALAGVATAASGDAAGTDRLSSSTSRAEVVNGSASRSRTTAAGDLAGEPLLAVVAQDPLEVGGGVGVEDLGGGDAGGLVHPHVERRVLAVGEAPVGLVELEGGDAEVEEAASTSGDAELVERPRTSS